MVERKLRQVQQQCVPVNTVSHVFDDLPNAGEVDEALISFTIVS